MLLVGDIGGTKTDLAIVSAEAGPRAPLVESTFPSAQNAGLEDIVRDFLSQVDFHVDRACFGVAGPVVNGRAKLTNLPWIIEAKRLRESFDLSAVWLLNDLEAIANAVPYLESDDLQPLNEGERAKRGAIAVLAPGTGLGEAFLTWDGARYRAHASEGSHADFAPTDPLQMELLRTLWEKSKHVSVENVCSGLGLPHIYAALKTKDSFQEPDWLGKQLASAGDHTPVIINAALYVDPPCVLCRKTLDVFAAILGAEAGNLALKVLATSGVYLAGGIPPRILPVLEQGIFMDAFRRKGRFSELLRQIPVHVVLYPKVALLGAACYGLESEHG